MMQNNVQMLTTWEDKTAVPSVSHLPIVHTTKLTGNRRDFLYDASQAWAGVLYVLHLDTSVQAPRRIRTATIVQANSATVKRLEMDVKRAKKGQMNDMSSQLVIESNMAQIWDPTKGDHGGWADGVAVDPVDPTTVNHIGWHYRLYSDRTVYEMVEVNGQQYNIDRDFPTYQTPWGDVTLLQAQSSVNAPTKGVQVSHWATGVDIS